MIEIYNFYFGWMLYNVIIIILLSFLFFDKKVPAYQSGLFLFLCFFLFFFLALFGNRITPDYPSYKEIVVSYLNIEDSHIEDFYKYVIPYLGGNYFFYVFFSNLVSFLTLYVVLVKLKLCNNEIFLSLFSVLLLYYWINGRQYVFYSVYILGVVFLAEKKYVYSISFLLFSFFLHKISILAFLFLFLSGINLKGTRMCFVLFSFIVLLILCNCFIDDYVEYLFLDEKLNFSGMYYLTLDEGRHDRGSMWWMIIRVYQMTVNFIFSFYLLWNLRKIQFYSRINRVMYSLLFWSTLASLFFCSLNLPDDTYARRTFTLGLIPMCYLFSILPEYLNLSRMHKISFFIFFLFYIVFNNIYIMGIRNSL